MASSTSNSRNLDLSRCTTISSSTRPQLSTDQNRNDDNNRLSAEMKVDGILRNFYSAAPATETTLVDASFTVIDAPVLNAVADNFEASQVQALADFNNNVVRSVDEVWRKIVSGKRKEITMKEEAPNEMMTLEDFLAKAGAVEEEEEVKLHTDRLGGRVYPFDPVGGVRFRYWIRWRGQLLGSGTGWKLLGVEVMEGEGREEEGFYWSRWVKR
ncbi:Detected protein of unknown function [Hibiscus syriacus]|uniref:Uncharacterized protein n=1 Tax=Hibiscus syriacus TaxID=106335 RepID=A0A6A2YV84_HIBSY|nr:Detected protein of unknown function [Hibiscus syriacus]